MPDVNTHRVGVVVGLGNGTSPNLDLAPSPNEDEVDKDDEGEVVAEDGAGPHGRCCTGEGVDEGISHSIVPSLAGDADGEGRPVSIDSEIGFEVSTPRPNVPSSIQHKDQHTNLQSIQIK